MAKSEISPRMRKMLEKGRAEARKRVIERGLVQFRADADTMEQLLEISENRGIPLGTILREWTKDRLKQGGQKVEQSMVIQHYNLLQEIMLSQKNMAMEFSRIMDLYFRGHRER